MLSAGRLLRLLRKAEMPLMIWASTLSRRKRTARRRFFFAYRIYRIMTPALAQASSVSLSHRLACTSPMWQVPIINMHRRL